MAVSDKKQKKRVGIVRSLLTEGWRIISQSKSLVMLRHWRNGNWLYLVDNGNSIDFILNGKIIKTECLL